jgi:serine/threonine protein kinase/WD40 repeat protein
VKTPPEKSRSSDAGSGSLERHLFIGALDKPAGAERAAFLEVATGTDKDLRRRLEALLLKFDALGTFLEEPAVSTPKALPRLTAAEPSDKTVPADSLTEKSGDRIGHYKLLQQIGEGGCGVVYMAEQEQPVRRRVALKVIRLGMDTKNVIARFEAEGQALALMDHPNIAKVLDAGATETGRPYFVMELVRGIKITDYCDQNNLPTKQRLELFIQICRAIQHAHQKGIIHRDIKPSNILVTLHDGIPLPKVIDFGIAKATTDQRLTDKTLFTQFEQFIGTPAYMSPEQAELGGLDIDTRSDIYSLGVLLYELLTGKTPFDSKELLASGLDEMRRTIREKQPMRPSTRLGTMLVGELTTTAKRRACEAPKLIHALRGDLDWIVMKALEKDRTRRYETANGLALDVQRHLDHEAVTARPPSQLYRFRKLVSRNRLAFAAAAAVVIALLLGTMVSTWQAMLAMKAKAEAVTNAQNANQARLKESAARAEAEQNLYVSLVREAHQTRLVRSPGYRKVVFDLLRRARLLLNTNADPVELRCEASQCLGDFVGFDSTVLRNFPANIQLTCLDFEGHLVAFALEDSTIILCEIPSGEVLAHLSSEPGIMSLCFSRDGSEILAVYPSNKVSRWSRTDSKQWTEIGESFTVPGVFGCFSSVKGQFLAINNSSARRVELLDSKTKALAHAVPYPQEIGLDRGLTGALSRDDCYFVVGGDSETKGVVMQVWDFLSEKGVVLREPSLAYLFSLNFSDQSEYLSCLSNTGGRIYANPGWQLVENVRDQFDFNGPTGIAFAPDRTIVAWPLIGRHEIRIRDWARNQDLAVLKEPRRAEQVSFIGKGKLLLTSGGKQARLYQLSTQERLPLNAQGSINAIAFNPKKPNLAAVGKDNTVSVWDLASAKVIWTNALPGQGESVAYSPDGNLLAAGVHGNTPVLVWDAQTGKQLSQLDTTPACVWSVGFSPDGRYLAAAGEPDGVNVWALEQYRTGTTEPWHQPSLIKSFHGSCGGLDFSPDSHRLVFMEKKPDHHEADVWDFTGISRPHTVTTNLSFDYQAQAFTQRGRFLLNTDTHRAIVRLDLADDKEVFRFMVDELSQEELVDATRQREWGGIARFCLPPDGRKIAVAPLSRRGIDIWDPTTGRKLYSLSDQSGVFGRVAWSADSRVLGVPGQNGNISVWNLQEVEQVLAGLGLGYEP